MLTEEEVENKTAAYVLWKEGEKKKKSDPSFTSNILSFTISLLQKHLVPFRCSTGIIPFFGSLKSQ